jgi:hypothetical protein
MASDPKPTPKPADGSSSSEAQQGAGQQAQQSKTADPKASAAPRPVKYNESDVRVTSIPDTPKK